jgi:hypothetical protein
MANIELDGANKKIKVDSGDLTLDIPGDIILDADGGDLTFADGGTNILKVTNSSSDAVFQPQVDAKDIKFNQYDGRTLLDINDGGFVGIANGATGPGQLRLYEDTDNGTNYTALQVGTQSGDITYTLPTADGSNGHALTTNGSGTLSWASAGTTYAGIDDQSSSNDDQLTITDTAIIINEDSDDVDFRIESNANANAFVVNGGDSRVGIGADPDLGATNSLHIKLGDSGASVDDDADALVIEDTHGVGMTLLGGNDDELSIHFGDDGDANIGFIKYHHNTNTMHFGTSGAEKLQIKEGDSNHFYRFDSTQTTEARYVMYIMSDKTEGNSANRMIGFDNSSQGRGYIVAGDGDSDPPSFAAGSDRRLKENITNYTGGYDKIKSIPVKQWDEKYSSKKKGKVGWIADELDDVFPSAVSGTPNATRDVKNAILDKDGRLTLEDVDKEYLDKKQASGRWSDCTFHETATVPDYQYSSPLKFFPDVVQALQASITKIETLETKVKALEG